VRAGDLCARIGGEEFVVLAPNLGPLSALDLADRIRRGLAERASRTTGRLSVSIGIACASVDGHDLDRLLACADRALYEAKASGRDCVRQSAGRVPAPAARPRAAGAASSSVEA
jgi:diguanylate cyclase (GGDEF)-like protein